MLIPKRLKELLINVKGNLQTTNEYIEMPAMYGNKRSFSPGDFIIEFEIDTGDYESWVCCNEWIKHKKNIDIGPFKSIHIESIYRYPFMKDNIYRFKAVFICKDFDRSNHNWRDWFFKGDTEYEEF